MNTKKCTNCNEIKSLDEFSKDKNGKYGLRGNCKQCEKQYKIDNKDKIKKYRIDNKYKIKEHKKQYRIDNKYKIKEYNKQYNIDNKDKRKQYHKQYNIDNKDKRKEDQKQYRKSFALYETYAHQLTIEEEPKLSDDSISLEVKCKYCGKYFIPNNIQINSRIKSINGKKSGDSSLYCSDGCKKSCGTFNRSKYPEGFNINTSREVQPQLRKLVLERDDWKCQKCYSEKELHCHHIDGVEINPIESADIDNCIALCRKCHNKLHKGCDMRRKKCKKEV